MNPSSSKQPRPTPDAPGIGRERYFTDWGVGLGLLAIALLAYLPVWRAGFVWDDDGHVTPAALRTWRGLARIWTDPGATQQYYPVLHTAFWLEHRLWGDRALSYHLGNVLLHATVAWLLWRALRQLAVPGAVLGATIFAVHPVGVESVAWISEQKNTMSAVFYLLAGLAYLRFDRERRWRWYALGLGMFVLALLSKSVTATLPAALLVVFWWQRGCLRAKADVLPLLPWFALGAGAGAVTAWMERTSIGASGAAHALNLPDRCLVAGRAVWFYAGKLVWPVNLTFIYPRWTIDARDAAQYLFPAAALATLAVGWLGRKRARGPLATLLLFGGTLFPALGFINVFPFLYSYVADHFQYLASAMLIPAATAVAVLAVDRWAPARWAATFLATALGATLAVLTWRQAATYADSETLWRTTIARNPSCWMAYNNLGGELLQAGRTAEAITQIELGLRHGPGNAAGYVNLGDARQREGRTEEAFAQYRRALELEPDHPTAHNNLAAALVQAGRMDEAVAHYQKAIASKPDFAAAYTNLGDVYLQSGRTAEAVPLYRRALELDPDNVEAHTNLGTASVLQGRAAEAIGHFTRALALNPAFVTARVNLANILLQTNRPGEAIPQYRRALELGPDSASVRDNLGYALQQVGRVDEAIVQFRKAIELDPQNARFRQSLDEALAQPAARN